VDRHPSRLRALTKALSEAWTKHLRAWILPVVPALAGVVVGAMLTYQVNEHARATAVRRALVPELVENQTVLAWKLTVAMQPRNPPHAIVDADGRLRIINPDTSRCLFEWSIYDAVKPDLGRLDMEHMLSVVAYYSMLRDLERERLNINRMYAAGSRDMWIRQDYEALFAPICERAFQMGNALLRDFCKREVPRDQLGYAAADTAKPGSPSDTQEGR
jgi:hypothetical protein